MKLWVDSRYLEEREQFRLLATCEHCAHFDDDARVCSYTYPTEPHRDATHEALKEGDTLMFCKTFEMG